MALRVSTAGPRGLPAAITICFSSVAAVWTAQPAAASEFYLTQLWHHKLNLNGYRRTRLFVNQTVAGFTGSTLTGQYSFDNTNWFDLTPNMPFDNANTFVTSAWGNIPAAARTDVFLRVIGTGGNATLSPAIRGLWLGLE